MSDEKRKLLKDVAEYINRTLEGRTAEGEGFISALVNTVDTARHAKWLKEGTQDIRERNLLEFILEHRNF